jgi:hypothetical protein
MSYDDYRRQRLKTAGFCIDCEKRFRPASSERESISAENDGVCNGCIKERRKRRAERQRLTYGRTP